jgi:hypothetical protein
MLVKRFSLVGEKLAVLTKFPLTEQFSLCPKLQLGDPSLEAPSPSVTENMLVKRFSLVGEKLAVLTKFPLIEQFPLCLKLQLEDTPLVESNPSVPENTLVRQLSLVREKLAVFTKPPLEKHFSLCLKLELEDPPFVELNSLVNVILWVKETLSVANNHPLPINLLELEKLLLKVNVEVGQTYIIRQPVEFRKFIPVRRQILKANPNTLVPNIKYLPIPPLRPSRSK